MARPGATARCEGWPGVVARCKAGGQARGGWRGCKGAAQVPKVVARVGRGAMARWARCEGCGGTGVRYRRWHVGPVTKRPRKLPIRSGTLPVTWCGWPVFDGSTSRGCSAFVRGPWGRSAYNRSSSRMSLVSRAVMSFVLQDQGNGNPWPRFFTFRFNHGRMGRRIGWGSSPGFRFTLAGLPRRYGGDWRTRPARR